MATELEITASPDEVPVMTLPNVVFFPQALLPLHVFEERYREMLADVLASNRLFAVAGLDERTGADPGGNRALAQNCGDWHRAGLPEK